MFGTLMELAWVLRLAVVAGLQKMDACFDTRTDQTYIDGCMNVLEVHF